MKVRLGRVSKPVVQITAVLMLGAALSACSTVGGWLGDDFNGPGSSNQGLLGDQASDQPVDNNQDQSGGQPGLAYIPSRPQPSSTAQQRQQVADSLAADRSRQQYSSQQLRGDKAPMGAPPPPEPEQTQQQVSMASPSSAVPAAAPTEPVAVQQENPVQQAPQQYASSGGVPAVPASASGVVTGDSDSAPTLSSVTPTDAQLGFKPSKAPPLDPSIAQFVPAPILARFQQTAALAPAGTVAPSTSAAVPAAAASSNTGGMGGPEAMSGSVVANFDALQGTSAYTGQAGGPAEVVFFPHDTTVLNSKGRKLVRAAAETYRQRGGQGYVRVVGHSSSRTANMPLARHIELNFERSQARATAVARELIRDGVPAEKVLVQAVGDSQPVYYESMPKGEEGNRRAEIFIQG